MPPRRRASTRSPLWREKAPPRSNETTPWCDDTETDALFERLNARASLPRARRWMAEHRLSSPAEATIEAILARSEREFGPLARSGTRRSYERRFSISLRIRSTRRHVSQRAGCAFGLECGCPIRRGECRAPASIQFSAGSGGMGEIPARSSESPRMQRTERSRGRRFLNGPPRPAGERSASRASR